MAPFTDHWAVSVSPNYLLPLKNWLKMAGVAAESIPATPSLDMIYGVIFGDGTDCEGVGKTVSLKVTITTIKTLSTIGGASRSRPRPAFIRMPNRDLRPKDDLFFLGKGRYWRAMYRTFPYYG